jgi:uncharacterized membrane protein YgdD (TMEM256/DUF423 family)
MPHQDDPAQRELNAPSYVVFAGVLCIVGSILARSVLGPEPGYNNVFATIGYAGLVLFVVGFLILVTTE